VLYLALRGFASNAERRRLISVGLLCLGVAESFNVWQVWIGERDSSFQMVGTFYWHNQFGAFAGAIALLACGMVMRSARPEDAIAWVIAPLFLALTWLSHSRAGMLALLATSLCLPAAAVLRRQWWALLRALAAVALAFAVHALFVAAVSGTGTGQAFSPAKGSLAATSAFRLAAGEEAVKVFAHAPLISHGYGSLAVTGWQHVAAGTTISPYAHSAEAQALSDGGLFLGLPVVLALALMAWSALRNGLRSARRPRAPDWVRLGACLSALAMLLHTSMDFDSQYPVLAALLALFVALAAQTSNSSAHPNRLTVRRLAVGITVAAAALGSVMAASYWQTTQRLNAAEVSLSPDSARAVAMARTVLSDHHFTDPRPAVFLVRAAAAGVTPDEATLKKALAESKSYARLDASFSPIWTQVNAEVLAASPPIGSTTTPG